ncbi:hypothetical protein MMC11_005247 [Xylographa trunciseda]|nr:hypothetical protein [Xylographa trunciseda]
MYEDEMDSDFGRENLDASQSSPVEDFNYANIDPELLLLSPTDAADTTTTDPSLFDTAITDPLPIQDTYNVQLTTVPQSSVLPFRPQHYTHPPAPAFSFPEHPTFLEMANSGWIQEGDAYLLRLDIPSTPTATRPHRSIPSFHTRVFYAYVTKVEDGKVFVSPDAVYLQSIEVRDPQEIVEAMARENFDYIAKFCEMQDPWILEVVSVDRQFGRKIMGPVESDEGDM